MVNKGSFDTLNGEEVENLDGITKTGVYYGRLFENTWSTAIAAIQPDNIGFAIGVRTQGNTQNPSKIFSATKASDGNWKTASISNDKSLNFIGYLGPQAEASNYLLYPLYHDKFSVPSNNPNWLPYAFFGSNDLIIGYETSNDYGTQLKIPHGEDRIYKRSRNNSKTWSEWVAI